MAKKENFVNVRRALDSRILEFSFLPSKINEKVLDLDVLLSSVYSKMESVLTREIEPGSAMKIQVLIKLGLHKFLFDTNQDVWIGAWFVSCNFLVLTLNQIQEGLLEAFHEILRSFDTFVQQGSGWTLDDVKDIVLRVTKFRLFRGGCKRDDLPPALRNCRGILHPLNAPHDNKCFFYALTLALGFASKKRANKRVNRLTRQDFKFVKFLLQKIKNISSGDDVSLADVVALEKQVSTFSISIFGFESVNLSDSKKKLFPYYVSSFLNERKCHVNLLLHNHHYYAISNLSSIVKKHSKVNCRKTLVCNFCLSTYISKTSFDLHSTLCNKKGYHYQLPLQKKFMTFSNFRNLFCVPFVIYIDLESSMDPIEMIDPMEHRKQFSKINHRCISWASVTICRPNENFNNPPVVFTGEKPIEKLLEFLKQEVLRIQNILECCNFPLMLTQSDEEKFFSTSFCWCCHNYFDPANGLFSKVYDHCHLSGRFRSALCDHCNFTYAKTRTNVVAFFHGLSNYDSHFIVKELHKFSDVDIKIIPKTSEKYLSFSVKNLHFKDSYHFLADKLEVLAKNLRDKGVHNFIYSNKYIDSEEKLNLMCQKGIFPYSYIKSLSVLEESSLPPKEAFFNDLTQSSVAEKDYLFAQKVWSSFNCKCLKDYLHVYLQADVLLLADVFENFRSNCIDQFELDPSHYFSLPHFTFDAYLRKTNVALELLTDIDMYLLFSHSVRGGLSVVSNRYCLANNENFSETYDSTKPKSYIIYIDANNLYGKSMLQRLPYKDFKWIQPTEENVQNILNSSLDEDFNPFVDKEGFLLEVDLHYPSEFHDAHEDMPLAPVRRGIKYSQLSPYAKELCDKLKLKSSLNTEKLLATLEDKERYVLYYKNLILYLKLGLKLTKVHKIISFKENYIMKDYIEFNSRKRAESKNDFDINFYKFLSNSLFGKTMERPENKTIVKLVSSIKSYENYVSRLNFKQAKIIHKDLVSVEMKKPVFYINKPFYIGAIILELAKFHIYDFHYNVMKKNFGKNIKVLYTDTDSFIYQITCDDINLELKKIENWFDFSNYPKSHELYSVKSKKVPGKFKDETASNPIKEFVGLKSKMYSFTVKENSNLKEVKAAKGVKTNVIQKDLKLEQYKDVLFTNKQLEHEFRNIRSEKHQVFTSHEKKISLSPFDDKRFLLNNCISLPYGHYKLAEEGFLSNLK